MQYEAIGNFNIIEKIGEGGMGEVFKGFDTLLEREVAIKSLKPELTLHENLVARFKTEAIALARLNHPNITTLYSFFQHHGQYFMVMEFAHGTTLSKLIKYHRKVAIPDAVRMVCQALDGLDHAHSMGIVHKDIKPANMMLTNRHSIKLMDFGIARILEKSRLTQTGFLVGTLRYMSPEQMCGTEAAPQVDLYSLGVVLYELLTGRAPFESESDYELMKAKMENKPPPPQRFNSEIPSGLQSVILKALSKQPNQRHASAQDFSRALQNAVGPIAAANTRAAQSGLTQLTVVDKTEKLNTVVTRSRDALRRYGGAIALFLVPVIVALVITAGNYQEYTLDSLVRAGSLKFISTSPSGEMAIDQPKTDLPLKTTTAGLDPAGLTENSSVPPTNDPDIELVGNQSLERAAGPESLPAKPVHSPAKSVARQRSSAMKVQAAKVAITPTKPANLRLTDHVSPPAAPEPEAQLTPSAGWAIEK